jgi:outer membrane protein assembly factor BamB
MICLSARSGELVYQKRLPASGSYYASPIASEGKIYTLSERGETCVVEEGPEFKILATNAVGERCMASPAVSRGQIFIRSDSSLFCIGASGL